MVKHIVMFKFRGDAAQRRALAQQFAQALRALPPVIPCLQAIEVGLNANPAESFDLVLTALVPTMADVPLYANHPAHLAAAAIVKGGVEVRGCVDYVIPQ